MKIVIDRDIPYIVGVFEPFAEVAYLEGAAITAADVRDADALVVRTRTRCDRLLLDRSRVRLIATATIGFDHIDTDYCARAGITVATAAGSNARGVLQWVGAALAEVARKQLWQPRERVLGVVGMGHVGSIVADYAARWGFEVVCCDPPRRRAESSDGRAKSHGNLDAGPSGDASKFMELSEIARRCDIITFHVPLVRGGRDATFHMAGREFFESLRPDALIINSSRGEVVDTAALADSVGRGACSCVVDTWENESDIDRRMLALATLATPHIAGYTAQGKANATSMAVGAVAREFALPLVGWYPSGEVPRVEHRPIAWGELCRTIGSYFDINTLSDRLKADPAGFEAMRNTYKYRTEYF